MHYQFNPRSYLDVGLSSEQSTITKLLFPLVPNDESIICQSFKTYYDRLNPYHVMLLQQRCFKSCDPRVFQIYDKLRLMFHPDLPLPEYSMYFPRSCYIDLKCIFQWMDQKCEYPSLQKEGNQQIPEILDNLFQLFSFVPNLERQLLNYPTYLSKLESERMLLFNGANIKIHHANFCAIIVSLQAACPYMAARFANKFVDKEGDPKWLESVDSQPKELQPILPIFRKIVRSSWTICEEDFEFCKKSGFWTPAKVINYCALAIHINTLCTISLAMGLNLDEPCPFLKIDELQKVKKQYDSIVYDAYLEDKKQLSEQIKQTLQSQQLTREKLQQIQRKQIQPYMKSIGLQLKSQQMYKKVNEICSNILQPFIRIDKGPNQISPLSCMQENDYLEQVVRRLRDYKSQIIDTFYDRNNYVKKMTFGNFGKQQNVNTQNFRRSVRLYCEKLSGFTRKNIDYREKVRKNSTLTMPLKYYIRLLTLAPVYIKQPVLNEINHKSGNSQIDCFDLCHLAVLVAETKARCNMTTLLYNILEV